EMKQIMRWAGPRMLWRHPILTVRHLLDDRRPVPPLPEKYRPKK
ncbi:nitrous oxide-stimulated promoter family protein, partial [Mycobacterium tuberculosis]|nr:nitrous oxide-stimulated promoter family protein [Mycobacterium tuberculosis]